MSINDVDYLKKYSTIQSYAFLVNSADRDMTIYPSPSEYKIEFSRPFQNVIKFEVQDASIPRTMYNIDIYNNTLGFFIYDKNFFSNVNANYTSSNNISFNQYFYNQCQSNMNYVSIDPADYDIYSFLNVINNSLQMNLNNDSNNVLVNIITETVSSPPELKSQLRFRCPYPFIFDIYNSSISENLGFNSLVTSSELQNSINLNRETYYDYSYNFGLNLNNQAYYQTYYSFNSNIPTKYANATTFQNILYDGSTSISNPVTITNQNLIAQYFNISKSINGPGYIINIGIGFGSPSGGTDGIGTIVNWYIYNNNPNNNQPNINIVNNNLTNYLLNGIINVIAIDGTYTYLPIIPNGNPLQPGDYWLILTIPLTSSDSIGVYTTSINNITSANFNNNTSLIYETNTNNQYQWNPYNTTGINEYYCISINFQSTYNVIIAPGIYSFIGEKYAILRCVEIEEHCFRSLALEKHFLGLAKFRLGVVGYTENALVYNTIPAREFHPIGKLTQLSFRFETPNKNLYDFKGCNHNMTFIIYYYEARPNNTTTWENSILNPNYNPNIIDYLYKDEDRDDESDEEDENTINFSRDKIENYKAIESRNLPENIQKIDLNAMYNITRSNKLS